MNKKIIGALAGTLFSCSIHANVIIDDFSVSTSIISAPGTLSSSLGASSDFSATRVLTVDKSGPDTASVAVFGGQLGVSTGFGTQSDTESSYENSAGYDFDSDISSGSVFDTFLLNLVTIDQGGVDITFSVNGISATKFVNTVGQVLFERSLFSGVDFTSITDIDIAIHNNIAVDATFDMIGYYGRQIINVSEPGMPAILALGLFGLVASRRLNK